MKIEIRKTSRNTVTTIVNDIKFNFTMKENNTFIEYLALFDKYNFNVKHPVVLNKLEKLFNNSINVHDALLIAMGHSLGNKYPKQSKK